VKQLSPSQLAYFRERLRLRRDTVNIQLVATQEEVFEAAESQLMEGTLSTQLADGSSDLITAEIAVATVGDLEFQLQAIDAALQRIAEGTYGTCRDCGQPIPIERLEALPAATRCITCERRHEKVSLALKW